MLDSIEAFKRVVNWLLEQSVICAVAVLVLDVLWGVFARFVMHSPSRWTEEVATFLLIWVSLLGAAVAYDRQEHLGVDYFVKKLDPSAQLVLSIAVQLVVIGFVISAMICGGYVLVSETLLSGQLTPALEIRMGYVYVAVPVSGICITLSSIQRVVELLLQKQPIAEGYSDLEESE